ncbi:hypothetical protein NoPa_00131 [Pseudomonas phage vB_PpuM-NoPa]|uniref:Uncharacterized protein n=4 Tax=Tartuvirus TaxID=3424912 RepID=A0AAX4MXZ5_9CAUD
MLSPEELRLLDARIRANADRVIRNATSDLYTYKGGAGPKPASFCNCVQPEMTEVLYNDEEKWPLWVDDIVSGVARLDWYGAREQQVPLSKKKIVQCFALLDTISASNISHLLKLGKRMSLYYYKACELLHQKLIDGYCTQSVYSLHYPEVFIYPREMIPQTDVTD